MSSKYTVLIIAFIGTLLAVTWQEVNLSYVQDSHPGREEYGRIITADDGSYVQPPMMWRKTGVWKDYTIGNSSYVQRPPGYGILFLVGTYITPSNPYYFLKIIQIIGFFFSILLIFKLLKLFEINRKWALAGTIIYAIIPTFSGFLYHVITEGITPVLLLWSMFEWILILKEKGNKTRWISSNAFLLLVRPQLAVFVLLYMAYLLFKKRFKLLLLSTVILLPFALWMVRVYSYTGSMSMHPIYAENNQSLYRPPHQAMGELFKVWEYKSDRFHETIALLQRDTSSESVVLAMKNIPVKYEYEVQDVLVHYQMVCMYQRRAIESGDFDDILKYERRFCDKVQRLQSDLAASNIVDAYMKTPVKSAKELFVNSHLHLTIFQEKYRGSIWMEALRWMSLLLVLVGITTLFVNVAFWKNVPTELWLICLAAVITILYLVFVQRLNEERYLTPILPLAFIASVWMMHAVVGKLQKNRSRN